MHLSHTVRSPGLSCLESAGHPGNLIHKSTLSAPLRLLFLFSLLIAVPLQAAVVTIPAVADTSLFQANPSSSLGASTLAVGVTESGHVSRGLIRFDLTGSLPEGSTITSVILTLYATRGPHRGGIASTIGAHKSLVPWQEGTGTGNTGSAALSGDSTWSFRAHNSSPWAEAGGAPGFDFSALASTSSAMNSLGAVVFPSTPAMIDVVQDWLAAPASNYGFFLLAVDESTPGSARRIASTEDFSQGLSPVPAQPPALTITFDVIPEPASWILLAGAAALLFFWKPRRSRPSKDPN